MKNPWTTALFILAFLSLVSILAQSPTAPVAVQQSADEQIKQRQLTSDLIDHMHRNFNNTSWYLLVEAVGVTADLSERTFSVRAQTTIRPESVARDFAKPIAAALKSWSLSAAQSEGLTLRILTVYGKRAGEPVAMRSWDRGAGWRDW